MNLKFWKREEPEYYDEGQVKPKKPETLRDTATRIMQRQMKRDASYGLQASERILGVADKSNDKSLASQLKELKEVQSALRSVAGKESDSGGSWLKEFANSFGAAIAPVAAQILAQRMQPQPNQELSQPQAQAQLPQGQTQPQPQPQPEPISLTSLASLLELEPKEAVEQLSSEHPDWLMFLSSQNYDKLATLLLQVPQTPENKSYLEELLSQNRKSWVKNLITEARKLVRIQINKEKGTNTGEK